MRLVVRFEIAAADVITLGRAFPQFETFNFIRSVLRRMDYPSLADRSIGLFRACMEKEGFRWGKTSVRIASACIFIALRESGTGGTVETVAVSPGLNFHDAFCAANPGLTFSTSCNKERHRSPRIETFQGRVPNTPNAGHQIGNFESSGSYTTTPKIGFRCSLRSDSEASNGTSRFPYRYLTQRHP